jgi:hypothetical protein
VTTVPALSTDENHSFDNLYGGWEGVNGVAAAAGPKLASCPDGLRWLSIQQGLGLAPRTIEAYARGLADFLVVCEQQGFDPRVEAPLEAVQAALDHSNLATTSVYLRQLEGQEDPWWPKLARELGLDGRGEATFPASLAPTRRAAGENRHAGPR